MEKNKKNDKINDNMNTPKFIHSRRTSLFAINDSGDCDFTVSFPLESDAYKDNLDKEILDWDAAVHAKHREIKERIAAQTTMKLKPIRAELTSEQRIFIEQKPVIDELLSNSIVFRKNVEYFLKLHEMVENEKQGNQKHMKNILQKKCNDILNANVFDC